jgi:hypothetical protein
MASDRVDLLNHLQHAMEESVLFDNYQMLVSPFAAIKKEATHFGGPAILPTRHF